MPQSPPTPSACNPLVETHLVRKSSAARRALSICSRMLALSTVATRIWGDTDHQVIEFRVAQPRPMF